MKDINQYIEEKFAVLSKEGNMKRLIHQEIEYADKIFVEIDKHIKNFETDFQIFTEPHLYQFQFYVLGKIARVMSNNNWDVYIDYSKTGNTISFKLK